MYKRTIYGFGDSLVEGHCLGTGMLDALADRYDMDYKKYAKNGATVIPNIACLFENACIVPDVASQIEAAPAAVPDFVCFDGLINDAYRIVTGRYLGTQSITYDGNYDTGTFYGAFERICYLLRTKYQESYIFYICVHKMPTRDQKAQEILQKAARSVCEKWSIPYIDVYRSGLINTCLDGMRQRYSYDNEEKLTDGNGTHLNTAGYEKWYLPMLEDALMKYL